MWIKHNLVMLPTDEKANIFLGKRDKQLHYWFKGNTPNNVDTFQHLYITSDDKIQGGDWWINKDNNCLNNDSRIAYLANNAPSCKKIIATNDSSLHNLSQIPQSFIKHFVSEYNKGNVISEVWVEYEEKYTDGFTEDRVRRFYDKPVLKINPKNNTINIKQAKDSWSKEEVIQLIVDYTNDLSKQKYRGNTTTVINKWIEENL